MYKNIDYSYRYYELKHLKYNTVNTHLYNKLVSLITYFMSHAYNNNYNGYYFR